MRKCDYIFLAASIKTRREQSIKQRDAWPLGSTSYQYWQGQMGALSDLAYTFANNTSVNHDAFLTACGLTP